MHRERPSSGPPAASAVWAPAKVNLFLEVTARRPDGYHELRTLLVAVSLYDTLEFAPAPPATFHLSCTDPKLGTGPENLIVRAADLLRRHTGADAGADVRLTKRIPLEAGLAGGSTDAAATLVGLNRLWGLGLSADELTALAAELGSDVAFFLRPPAAWCTGRGEEVMPWPLGTRLHLVLVCPPFGLSTAAVYRGVRVPDAPETGDALKDAVRAGAVDTIGRLLHNRLQEPAEQLRPELADYRRQLADLGPAGCLLSGSGSTLFALGRDVTDARRLAGAARATFPEARVFVVRSCV
jgi:4-diphosphocytidyl-2-C-methyl-D-erythritol kinase